jgi:hypothetical protein
MVRRTRFRGPVRVGFVAAFSVAALLALSLVVFAQTYLVDSASSQALTTYLREHRLPLAGAQVLSDAAGKRHIVLYGFVATDFGKNDAARKALSYLNAKDLPVDNRIQVRPEIARMKPPGQPAPAVDPGAESLDQVLKDIDRYGVSIPPAERNRQP